MSARILLVEDDPVSREVIAAMLTSRGYEVDTAADGFGALRMAQDTAYSLIFIDYHLPEMDGYALARLMRSIGEKTNSDQKMVAITADQFGLAARRGVDKIFDRLLTKPIAPNDLFAFVDDALGPPVQDDDAVTSFLQPDDRLVGASEAPGLSLWRARGLDRMPTAKVFPPPTTNERASITNCFQITEDAAADCILLLRPAGLADVESFRCESASYLMPLFVIDPELADAADVLFEPSAGESWSKAAEVLSGFAARRGLVDPTVARSCKPHIRLAAYMFAADRGFELHRAPSGQIIVPFSAGFPVKMVAEAVKQLSGLKLIHSRLEASANGALPRLLIKLTADGIGCVKALTDRFQIKDERSNCELVQVV